MKSTNSDVLDEKWPQVKDVVPGELGPHFHHHHFRAQYRHLDRCPHPNRTSPDDQHLATVARCQTTCGLLWSYTFLNYNKLLR